MTYDQKVAALRRWGFQVGPRNYAVNTNYQGCFMVAEAFDPNDLPTRDGANGPWAIVGDSLTALVNEAYEAWFPWYFTFNPPFKKEIP